MMVMSFIFCLMLFVGIGMWSSRRAEATSEDYLLAGKKVSPWLAGLSGVASACSGFMFIGLMGATYFLGVYIYWMALGLFLGSLLAWVFVIGRFHQVASHSQSRTFPEYLAGGQAQGASKVKRLSALIVVLFLGAYAGAQLNAGSKALHVLVGLDFEAGALIGAGMIMIYCFSGGIRASIWTDAAQAIVMLAAMVTVCAVSWLKAGGWSEFWGLLSAIDPELATLTPLGKRPWWIYLLSCTILGFGLIGQPHVMIRAMTVRSADHLKKTRNVFLTYYGLFLVVSVTAGLCCRVFLKVGAGFDPELALPTLAMDMLPEILVGLVLAGVFASTISTADSQVLACSAALTEDLKLFGAKGGYWLHKMATGLVTLFVLSLSLLAPRSVFTVVILAWSILAASLGPLVVMRSLGRRITDGQGVAMMTFGLSGSVVARGLGFHEHMTDVLPGLVLGFAAYGVWPWVARRLPTGAIQGEKELV